MQGMRDGEDKDRPPDGGASQTDENEHSWVKTVIESAASWEEQQVEKEAKRANRPTIGANTMKCQEILSTANMAISERGKVYGDIRTNFTRAAIISSVTTNKNITAYDVALILSAVKQSRLVEDQANLDSWVDSAAYQAIAGQLATAAPTPSINSFTTELEAKLNEATFNATT